MPSSMIEPERLRAALLNPAMNRRVKLFDRAANTLIRFSGMAVILVVGLIMVFLAYEAWPLFQGASQKIVRHEKPPVGASEAAPLLVGIDEYETHAYVLPAGAGEVVFFNLPDWTAGESFPLPALADTRATSAYRFPVRDKFVVGTADGRIVVAEARFQSAYTADTRTVTASARQLGVVRAFRDGRAVRHVHGRQTSEGEFVLAAVAADGAIVTCTWAEGEPTELHDVGGELTGAISGLAIDFEEDKLFVATDAARLYQWYLAEDREAPFRVYELAGASVTALDFVIGDNSVLLGFGDGRVEQWAGVREKADDFLKPYHAINTFQDLPAAITAIQPSGRDKGFLVGAADGTVHLDFTTSRRMLLTAAAESPVRTFAYAPKLTSYLAAGGDGRVLFASVHNPHPETSWRVLFGEVHYEGYDEPAYVWQSTGGSDSSEAKLSLVPLLFGTLKAAFYGLLFAVPIAVLAALYTSQFMSPQLRSIVKPTVEIMAALPSVVIGFMAGLWLAPLLETRLVGALLVPLVVPWLIVIGAAAWHLLPATTRNRVPSGWDVVLLIPLVAFGIWFCQLLAPGVEALAFGGDFKQWIYSLFEHQIEQRNSVVIGFALGFAVIPIIFTISDDAFSNVPASFRSASFALGASPWQTAFRVILPTASPGVFSATMIGFGRAVGETMIVLMACGNTPIISFSPFDGMRSLAPNIAVEIPEAPVGGTLYRVLFVSALLLFALTFVVNTIAEIVRQRLRRRYQAV